MFLCRPAGYVCVNVCVCKMPLLAEHIWSDMDAVSAVNATQDELRLLDPTDDDPGNLGYHDYDPNTVANPPALPTFEGVNFPEDPIKLLSVQVEVSEYFDEMYVYMYSLSLVIFKKDSQPSADTV